MEIQVRRGESRKVSELMVKQKMKDTESGQYLEWVDLAKGMGIVFVVLGHAFRDEMRASSMACEYMYQLIYSFHMCFFWMISGVTCSLSSERHVSEKAQYAARRVKTLLIPLFAYSMLIYVCFFAAWQIPALGRLLDGSSYPLYGVREYLVMTLLAENPYAEHLWYIWILFLFSLGTFCWQAVSKKIRADWRILFPVSVFLCGYLCYADFHDIPMPALGIGITGYLIYFVFGAVLLPGRRILRGNSLSVRLFCLASWGILALEAANMAFDMGIGRGGWFGYVKYIVVVSAKIGVSVSLLRLAIRLEGRLPYLVYAGKKSFVIYLLHQPFCCGFVGVILYNGLGWPLMIVYGICVILSFAVPLLVLKLAEQIRILGIIMKKLFNVY